MSKDQILGFAVWAGVFAVVWGRDIPARIRARSDRKRQIQLAKYRHPGSQ
jgi:hypothetical protein